MTSNPPQPPSSQPTPTTLHKSSLTFEKKNQNMIKLPKNARVQKRPIPHPPPSNPYAGSNIPKTVYVSTKTPFMSGVKRVQKLLRQAEKRTLDALQITGPKVSDRKRLEMLEKGQENLKKEEVFVKGTGRAIEKVLSMGRWFEARGEEYSVRSKTGCVLVVDDVVEGEGSAEKKEGECESGVDLSTQSQSTAPGSATTATNSSAQSTAKSASKKRKRTANAVSEDAELPETRTRWVNMVEVAVSLK